jgi:inosine-uridine nucleoside N-ribohydrolase
MAVPVLLDCDPGHDDAIAIMLAAASPAIDLLGIATAAVTTTMWHRPGHNPMPGT